VHRQPGRALQVDPVKPLLKAPGPTLLKLKCDGLLSNFAFNFNLCHYNLASNKNLRVKLIKHKAYQLFVEMAKVPSARKDMAEYQRVAALGRGLHSFPFLLNFRTFGTHRSCWSSTLAASCHINGLIWVIRGIKWA